MTSSHMEDDSVSRFRSIWGQVIWGHAHGQSGVTVTVIEVTDHGQYQSGVSPSHMRPTLYIWPLILNDRVVSQTLTGKSGYNAHGLRP